MRLLCELAVVAGLILTAWQKPFGDRISEAIPLGGKAPPVALSAVPAAPAASPSGAWMWDPNRRTTLDRPAYNETRTFTGHIYYVDEANRRYWLDARGKRHYDN